MTLIGSREPEARILVRLYYNYYIGDYIGIMEKKMETIGIIEIILASSLPKHCFMLPRHAGISETSPFVLLECRPPSSLCNDFLWASNPQPQTWSLNPGT